MEERAKKPADDPITALEVPSGWKWVAWRGRLRPDFEWSLVSGDLVSRLALPGPMGLRADRSSRFAWLDYVLGRGLDSAAFAWLWAPSRT